MNTQLALDRSWRSSAMKAFLGAVFCSVWLVQVLGIVDETSRGRQEVGPWAVNQYMAVVGLAVTVWHLVRLVRPRRIGELTDREITIGSTAYDLQSVECIYVGLESTVAGDAMAIKVGGEVRWLLDISGDSRSALVRAAQDHGIHLDYSTKAPELGGWLSRVGLR